MGVFRPHTPFSFHDVRQLIVPLPFDVREPPMQTCISGSNPKAMLEMPHPDPGLPCGCGVASRKNRTASSFGTTNIFHQLFQLRNLSHKPIYIHIFRINIQLKEAERNKDTPIIYSGTVPHQGFQCLSIPSHQMLLFLFHRVQSLPIPWRWPSLEACGGSARHHEAT